MHSLARSSLLKVKVVLVISRSLTLLLRRSDITERFNPKVVLRQAIERKNLVFKFSQQIPSFAHYPTKQRDCLLIPMPCRLTMSSDVYSISSRNTMPDR